MNLTLNRETPSTKKLIKHAMEHTVYIYIDRTIYRYIHTSNALLLKGSPVDLGDPAHFVNHLVHPNPR